MKYVSEKLSFLVITKIIRFRWGKNLAFFVFKNASTILTKKTAQNRHFVNFEKKS